MNVKTFDMEKINRLIDEEKDLREYVNNILTMSDNWKNLFYLSKSRISDLEHEIKQLEDMRG